MSEVLERFSRSLTLLCIFLPLLWVWFRGVTEGVIRRDDKKLSLQNLRLLFKFFFVLLMACLGCCWLITTCSAVVCFREEGFPWELTLTVALVVQVVYAALFYLACQFYEGLRPDVVRVTGTGPSPMKRTPAHPTPPRPTPRRAKKPDRRSE